MDYASELPTTGGGGSFERNGRLLYRISRLLCSGLRNLSSSVRDITLTLTALEKTDTAKVTVFKIDLDWDGVSEEIEGETGIYIPLNNDNDDTDTWIDRDENDTAVAAESLGSLPKRALSLFCPPPNRGVSKQKQCAPFGEILSNNARPSPSHVAAAPSRRYNSTTAHTSIQGLLEFVGHNDRYTREHAVEALVKLTGQDLGNKIEDAPKWRDWWEQNKDSLLNSKRLGVERTRGHRPVSDLSP